MTNDSAQIRGWHRWERCLLLTDLALVIPTTTQVEAFIDIPEVVRSWKHQRHHGGKRHAGQQKRRNQRDDAARAKRRQGAEYRRGGDCKKNPLKCRKLKL